MQLLERAQAFVHETLTKHPTQTVLFVCHNGIGKALISVITEKDFKSLETLHNTSVSIFEIAEDRQHHIHLVNCVAHLT